MRRRSVLMAAAILVLGPSPSHAWGFEAHRFLMDRAIALLPAELRPLFEQQRAMVVERSIDPDTWRMAGFEAESKHHFLELDWTGYGKPPYLALPRDYTAAVAKFGRARIEKNGTLPWRADEYFHRLRRAFESQPRRGASGRFDILFFAASLGHYVSDAHVPFHAVVNYDGQLTGQQGIHARFESSLFERYRDRLRVAPAPLAPIRNPRDFVFDRLVESAGLVPAILRHDREANGTADGYGRAYFDAFFAASRAVLERRVNESIAAIAAAVAGAWDAAGRPSVPVEPAPTPQRRPRQ